MPRSWAENSKEYFALNEASRSNFNFKKRISKWRPFWNRVYEFIPQSLEMMPFVEDWVLIYRKWAILGCQRRLWSYTLFIKFQILKGSLLRDYMVYQVHIFRDSLYAMHFQYSILALLIFSVDWLENNTLLLMRKKCKQGLLHIESRSRVIRTPPIFFSFGARSIRAYSLLKRILLFRLVNGQCINRL